MNVRDPRVDSARAVGGDERYAAGARAGGGALAAAATPSWFATVLAASMPFVVGGVATLLALVGMAGARGGGLVSLLQETGWVGYAVLLLSGLCAPALAVLLGLAGRGYRVPSALAVGVAAMPWLLGAAGVRLGMSQVRAALEFVTIDPSMRAALLARGVAEASGARLLGAWCASALLGGTALGLAIAAAGQRAPNRKLAAGLLGVLLGVPLVGVAGWLFASQAHGAAGLVVVASTLGAWATLALGFGAAAGDVPHGRAAALAASAGPAAVVAALAALAASETSGLVAVFGAVAFAPSTSRSELLAVGVEEVFGLGGIARGVTVGGGALACLVLAGYAASRSRPSVGRVVGGGALALAALLPLGVERVVDALGARDGAELARGAFDDAPGFEPLVLDTGAPTRASDAFVTPEGVRLPDGTLVTPEEMASVAGRTRVAAALRVGRAPDEVERPAWLELAHPPEEQDARFSDERRRALAIDRRAPGRLIASTVAAAEQAGVTSLELLGTTTPVPEARRALVARHVPLLLGTLTTTGCATVYLTPAFPGAPAERDPALLHGTVGASPRVTLGTRPGAPEPGLVLDGASALEEATGRDHAPDEGIGGEMRRAWLALAPDASAESLARVAIAATRAALRPVLVAGVIPGDPERPLEPERPPHRGLEGVGGLGGVGGLEGSGPGAGFGGQDGGGAGEAVLDALPREAIQGVMRRANPRVRACYERRLRLRPDLSGTVRVRFVVGRGGVVQSVDASEDTTGDAELGVCVVDVVRTLRFPEPRGGGVVSVTYPFAFQPE